MKNIKKLMQSFILAITLLFGTAFFSACGGVNVTAITINDGPEFFEVGDEYTFTATLTPSKASNKDITWSSSNTAVASINENGKATAKSSGSTIITAMSKKNSNVKDTYTLVVYGEGSGVVMLSATYTYDGTQKPYEATYVPEGLELRYTYEIRDVYPESEFAPKDAGTYTVKAYNKISGSVISTTTLTIRKKSVNVSIGNYTKKYSEPDPTFAATVTGLVGEDTLEYSIERLSGENVENYKIYPVITPHKNYDPIISEGRLTIEQLPVKIIIDNKSSTYGDSLQTPTFTLQSPDNMLLDDVLKTQIYGLPVIEKPAGVTRLEQGSYSITADNLTSTNLNILSRQNGTYTVNKKIVTISIAAEQFKFAGQPEPALQYAIDGTLEGDDLSGCLSRVHGETVGFYEYNIDQSINTNYTITTEAGATAYKFEIRSNVVSISFDTFEINYSHTNKEDYIPTDCYNYTITLNDTPIEYNKDALGNIYLNATDSIALTHEVTKEAHMSDEEKAVFYQKWKIVPSKASTAGYSDPAKYTFNFVEGFKYLKLLNLNVYANETYKIYGEVDPTLTFSADGFLDGDDIESVLKTVELKRSTGEDVTTDGYTISLADDIELYDTKTYYNPVFTEGVFVIEKRELRVTPISYTEENPIYYGEAPRVLEIDLADINLAARDNINTVLSGELYRADNENVGQYPILGTNLELISDNYYLTYTPGVYTIIPRPMIIKASDATIQYGEVVSRYQYTHSIVDEFTYIDEDGEEQIEVRTYSTDAPTFSGSLALTTYGLLYANNSYTIGQGNLTAGGNFDVTFTPGTLTVVPRELTLAFTPQSYGFTEYDDLATMQEKIDALVYSFKPGLAYSDSCAIKYIGLTSRSESNIISLNKDTEENYIITFEFTSNTGTILEDCYNVTIDQNYVELFYLGQSLLDISIDSLTQVGTQIVEKTYGDKYLVNEVFKITTFSEEYTVEYTNAAFNIKGITSQTEKTTPSSTVFPAGSYTVTVFKELVVIKDKAGEDVSSMFALNIKNYGSLVVNKADLEIVEAPTISSIVYGSKRPTFIGGKYQFINGDGAPININGVDAEYSTSSTATYAVQSTAHLIMATYTPTDKNFNSLTINNLALVVTKQMIDTTVLEWSYGASVEKLGTADGNKYTTYTNIPADDGEERNIVYDGAYTAENTYNIPTTLANYRFLRQTLGMQNRYFGITFHDEENGDTGFMYYIDNGEVKKVFPADSNNFYVVLDKSAATLDVKFYYNDGSKDYLLTNSSSIGDGTPEYTDSVYSPKTSGVYLARTIISSLNSNYAVFEDGDPATTEETITYYNVFMVEKVQVKVYNFTNKITYQSDLEFFYITNPEEIYGVTSTYWDRDAASTNYTERTEDPVNVGTYAVTFLIDKANYYYYNEHCDFEIVPIEINVIWNETSSFNYVSTTSPITRHYKVFAGPALTIGGEEITANLVYDSADTTSVAPEWLHICYRGEMKNGDPYFDEGKIAEVAIPCNAGTYTIEISIETGSENYTGSDSETYEINPIFYNGAIGIIRYTMTYDIAYSDGVTGAEKFYNMLVFGKQEPENGDDDGMITNAPFGSDSWTNYYLTISYLSMIIDPTGTDNAAVIALNKAGGPYKITLSIKSKDGNIKETLKTANLTVNKTNVPTMANYSSEPSAISFTGSYVYNALTTIDKSALFEPQSYDESTLTYSYEHNGDRDIYFGIDYKYYLVWSTEETTGTPTQAPIVPRTDGFTYMVKASITAGANYNAPSQTEFIGYFTVEKTTATLSAENIELVYTGENIELPFVNAVNGSQQPLAIKYENDANVLGLYVSRTIKNLDNNSNPTFIKKAGKYQVTFTLEDTTNFYTEGSTFTATCTIIVNKKPIDGLSNYVVVPEEFISTEILSIFYLNVANAKAYNKDYTNSSGSQALIQLCVTNSTDGSGDVWRLSSKADSSIKDLPAGTYYYYVDVSSSATASQNISNYTHSEYISFIVKRKEVVVTINPGYEDGIVINYTAEQQGYDVSYLTVKTTGSNKTITGLEAKDFLIEYKDTNENDSNYSDIAPITNGIYDVRIKCFNKNYESEYIYTTITIDAPLLSIEGNMSYTYGFVNELTLNLSAKGGENVHTISFDGTTNKYNEAALKNSLGRWFLVRDNFGVITPGGPIPTDFTLDDGRIIGDQINNGLAAMPSPMYTGEELINLPAGIHKMTIVYISNDINFAITFAEISFTVNPYAITEDAIVSSNTAGITFDSSTKKFSLLENANAVSEYNTSFYSTENPTYWGFSDYTINKSVTFEISVKIKNPTATDYTNAETIQLNLVANISGTIAGTTIKNAFAQIADVSSSAVATTSTTLSFDNTNYSLTVGSLEFILNTVFNKQETTVFTEKLSGSNLVEIEASYGSIFLDEYWANLFEKTRASYDYPDSVVVNSNHIFLHNLINLPGGSDIDKFRNAWNYGSEDTWFEFYSINAYEYNNGTKGNKAEYKNVYNESDGKRPLGDGLYHYYKYDLDSSTNAGLYLLEIKLNTSNYFLETVLNALVRIKPTTFYAKTTNAGSGDGLIDVSNPAHQSEIIKVYKSINNGSDAASDGYTLKYFRDGVTNPVYVSKYSGGASGTYTPQSGYTYSSYAQLLESVKNNPNGAESFTVSIVPNDTNSMYVADIRILVINGTIDLGVFNIYDELKLSTLAETNETIRTLHSMSKGGDDGLTWPTFVAAAFEYSYNSLTEGSISALRAIDQCENAADRLTPDADGTYNVSISPNENNQVSIAKIPLSINFDTGSTISVMIKLTVNLKLITEIDTFNFEYNGSAQSPNISAYFQGWTAKVPMLENGGADLGNVEIQEVLPATKYTGSTPTIKYINQATGAESTTVPVDAGNYAIKTTYTVNFAGFATPVVFTCSNNFTISKIEAAITMSSAEYLYDGQTHTLSATTSISGLPINISYRTSSATTITNPYTADIYYAVATINSTNYFGTAVATLTIKPTSTRIEITMPTDYVYSGSTIKPTFKIFNENNVDITAAVGSMARAYYNGITTAPTYAGSYEYKVVVTKSQNFFANEAKANYVIERAVPNITITAPTNTTYVAEGHEIVPTFNYPASLRDVITITYNGSEDEPCDAGIYEVYVYCNPSADSNYLPTTQSFTYKIYPKTLQVSYDTTGTLVMTYSEDMSLDDLRPNAPSDADVLYSYQGFEYNADGTLSDTFREYTEFPENAGVYTIIATPRSTNYSGRVSTTLVIARATPVITFNISGSIVYNGNPRSPQIVKTVESLTYVTSYTGVDNDGVSYSSTTSAPTNAGNYVVKVSFAGNNNYNAVESSQNFEIEKLSTITLSFDTLSLSQMYTGEGLTPTAKAFLNTTERTDLFDSIEMTFGEDKTLPVDSGTYVVKAMLVNCNYSAPVITESFTITKSNNYTVTLYNGGQLNIGATAIGEVVINGTYIFKYVGKTYLPDGTLSAVNNYDSFVIPELAGEYIATLIADNYLSSEYSFTINKTDLSSHLTLVNFNLAVGTLPNLHKTITYDSVTYNIKYLYQLENASEYTEVRPTTIGSHKIKMIVCDANAMGEKIADYVIYSVETTQNKAVTESLYYMYTGNDIVVNASLYLNGILQTGTITKTYQLNGEIVTHVSEIGEYTITLTNAAGEASTTFTVIPAISLSTPVNGDSFNGSAKTVTYQFTSSSDQSLYGADLSLVIMKDGYTVNEVKDAGQYVVSVCYKGYPVLSRDITINKKIVTNLSPSDINMSYGELNRIPTHIGSYKVKYLININGNNTFQEITPPVGNHTIKFIIDENNYQGEAIANIFVSKRTLILDIDDFEVEYTGNAIALPNYIANFEYMSYKYSLTPSNYIDGLPTDANTYYIQAVSSSPNFAVAYKDSSRPYIIVTITKANPTYVVTNLNQVYDGNIKVPTATAVFNGTQYTTSISNSNMRDAGAYTIYFTITSEPENFNRSIEYTFVIEQAEVDINYNIPEEMIFDGTQKAITATATIADVGSVHTSITKDGASATPRDAGVYVATFTTTATTNYKSCSKVVVFEILPAATEIQCSVDNYNYTGDAKPVSVLTNPTDSTKNITYTGADNEGNEYSSTTAPTKAGNYIAHIVVTPADTNYSREEINFAYTIVKVMDPITCTGADLGYFYYDGGEKSVTATSGSGTHSITYKKLNESNTYITIPETDVKTEGAYKAIVTTTGNNNYYASTKVVFFSIYKQRLETSISGKSVDYNGSPQQIVPTNTHSGLVQVYYSGKMYNAEGKCIENYAETTDAPTRAGIYTAVLKPTNENYAIKGTSSAPLIIKRTQLNISIDIDGVSATSTIINYTGSEYIVTANAMINGVKTDVSTIDANALTTRIVGTNTKIPLQQGGAYELIVDLNHKNFLGHNERLITIRPQSASIFATQTVANYTGQKIDIGYTIVSKTGTDITEEIRDKVQIIYTNAAGATVDPINTGDYTANIILANTSYVANATYSFTIVESTPLIIYKGGEDPITMETTNNTSLDKFDTSKYVVSVGGVDFSTTEYTVAFYKSSYSVVDGETVRVWNVVTAPTGTIISESGNYKVVINISNTSKYQNNLIGTDIKDSEGNITQTDVLTWEYLFYVSASE